MAFFCQPQIFCLSFFLCLLKGSVINGLFFFVNHKSFICFCFLSVVNRFCNKRRCFGSIKIFFFYFSVVKRFCNKWRFFLSIMNLLFCFCFFSVVKRFCNKCHFLLLITNLLFLYARLETVRYYVIGYGGWAGVHTGFHTITLVLYIGSLTNLATWFPCGRGRTLFILGSLGQRSRSPYPLL